MFLVQIDRQQFKSHRSALLQVAKHRQQCIAVLASAHADHDLVAIENHPKISDGLTRIFQKALGDVFHLQDTQRSGDHSLGQHQFLLRPDSPELYYFTLLQQTQ